MWTVCASLRLSVKRKCCWEGLSGALLSRLLPQGTCVEDLLFRSSLQEFWTSTTVGADCSSLRTPPPPVQNKLAIPTISPPHCLHRHAP